LLNGNKNLAYTIAISPDGKILASGGGKENEGELLLWNIQEQKLIGLLKGHNDPIFSVVFSSDGKTLFSSCYQTIRIWDVQEQKQIALLQPGKRVGWWIALNPDGKTLAYLAMTKPGYEADRFRIVLKSYPGGQQQVLTENWDFSPSSICFQCKYRPSIAFFVLLRHPQSFGPPPLGGQPKLKWLLSLGL
jgi:WD40 repeat protein